MHTKENTMSIVIIATIAAVTIAALVLTALEIARDGYRQIPTR
jgi:hypothetical protein